MRNISRTKALRDYSTKKLKTLIYEVKTAASLQRKAFDASHRVFDAVNGPVFTEKLPKRFDKLADLHYDIAMSMDGKYLSDKEIGKRLIALWPRRRSS